MNSFTTTFETQIDKLFGEDVFAGDEFEVPVTLDLLIKGDQYEILSITRLDNGAQIIPTTDIIQDLSENIDEAWDEIVGDYEASYADYRYELARDEREMQL